MGIMQETSLLAYFELQSSDKIGERHRLILLALQEMQEGTDWEITKHLGYTDPNKVRPRRRELAQLGYVTTNEKRPCKITNRMAIVWKIKTNEVK